MIFRTMNVLAFLKSMSVLLSKGVIKTGKIRTTDNASESQKDIYHLALLTLNLGAINTQPLIGGTKKFPSWIRRDPSCVVPSSPDLQEWRSYCRIVCSQWRKGQCHAWYGGRRRNYGSITCLFSPRNTWSWKFHWTPLPAPARTENKKQKNKFWILHGCIFRLAFGRVTSGEMVDPSSGIFRYMDSIANFHYS